MINEQLFCYREMTELERLQFRDGFRAAMPHLRAVGDASLDLQLRAETAQIIKVDQAWIDRFGPSFALGYAFGLQLKKEAR